jgi:hypothetical protein
VVGNYHQRDDGDGMAPIMVDFFGVEVRVLIGRASERAANRCASDSDQVGFVIGCSAQNFLLKKESRQLIGKIK